MNDVYPGLKDRIVVATEQIVVVGEGASVI